MARTSAKGSIRSAAAAEKRQLAALKKATRDGVRTDDSFQNFPGGVGIGTSNISTGSTYGFNPTTRNRILLEWMYRGSWLVGAGIDAIADDMTRAGITINSTGTPAENTKLLNELRDKQTFLKINEVIKWARLYGGALGVMMLDGQDPSTPLRIDTIGKGQFKGILPFDRWMVEPSLNDLVTEQGPNIGLPKFYRPTADAPGMRNQKIHYTRCFRIEGVKMPYWQKLMENLWGISVIERMFDRLVAFDSTTQGTAQLVYRAYLRILSIDKYREIMAAGGKPRVGLENGINMMRQMWTNEGIATIDVKDKFEAHQYSFGGLSDVMLRFAEQVCGAMGTVMARLFGQSPAGIGNAGDHELRTYYDTINQRQETDERPFLTQILQVQARSANVRLPDDFDWIFTDLWQLTSKEKQEIAQGNTQTVMDAMERSAVSRSVALKELRTASRITGVWTNISDEDIEEAENDPPPGTEALMGGEGSQTKPPNEPSTREPAFRGSDPLSETQDRRRRRHGDQARVVDVGGIPVYIETAKGEVRRGGVNGSSWRVTMPAHYGYIEGVGSAEGAFEQMDCYVGPHDDSPSVYVIDQRDPDTQIFDEHKCMLGYRTRGTALRDYVKSFSDGRGRDRLGGVSELTLDAFKSWLKDGDHHAPLRTRDKASAADDDKFAWSSDDLTFIGSDDDVPEYDGEVPADANVIDVELG